MSLPPKTAPGVTIEESLGSTLGQQYISASKDGSHTWGSKGLNIVTDEGRQAKGLFQVAEVSRPLTAVSQTCGRGNIVVYCPGGGFVHSMTSGEDTLRRDGGGDLRARPLRQV